MEADMIVMAIEAKLSNVWDRVENDDPNGKWESRQSVGLKIGSETIRATFWGYPELKKDKGKSFRIESTKSSKGWFGIKTTDNSWKMDNGKKDKDGNEVTEPERELTINDSAKMMPLSGSSNVDASTTSTTSTAKHLTGDGPPNKTVVSVDSYQRATDQLKRASNGILMVYSAFDYLMSHPDMAERNVSNEEMVQILITYLKAIDIDSLPVGEITDKPSDTGVVETPVGKKEVMTPAKAAEILGGGEPAEDEIPF